MNTDADSTEPMVPSRIEPQYIQAGVTYWVGLNSNIWQMLVLLLAVQSGACVGGFFLKGSLAGMLLVVLCWALSVLLAVSVHSATRVRKTLIKQLNFLTSEAMGRYLAHKHIPDDLKPEFILYDLSEDARYVFVRDVGATVGMHFFLVLFDAALVLAFNFPWTIEPIFAPFGMPMFPVSAR